MSRNYLEFTGGYRNYKILLMPYAILKLPNKKIR